MRRLHKDTLVNPGKRFTYVPIPKVACSSLKRWFMQSLEGVEVPRPTVRGEIHNLAKPYTLENYGWFKQLAVSCRYRHICFVRNPWERVVSAYVEKFVGPDPINFANKSVVEAIAVKRGQLGELTLEYPFAVGERKFLLKIDPQLDYGAVVRFCDFVEYLCEQEDFKLNPHWRPQATFTRGFTFFFTGKVENLDHHLRHVSGLLGVKTLGEHTNRTRYSETDHQDCSAMLPQELRKAGLRPRFESLFTPDLFEKTTKRFENDWRQFAYDPEVYRKRLVLLG